MIDKDEDISLSQNALSFKIKAKSSKKLVNSKPDKFDKKDFRENEDDNGNIEYITGADGANFKSSQRKKEPSKLVIPMIAQNKWLNQPTEDGDNLTKEALDEILNDLNSDENNEENEAAAIPLMLKNRLPTAKEGVAMDEKYDISLRPEESTIEDYGNIPVTSFGSAMLRGMGWSEKEAIGGVNKAAVAPVEFIPRHKGLGLGAEKGKDTRKMVRKRKLGETAEDKNKYKPIVDSDGRVRHTRRIGEEEPTEQTNDFLPGKYVVILKKPHKDLYGKIISVDEDTTRISVKLLISGDIIQISQYNACVVDKSEINTEKSSSSSSKNCSSAKNEVTNGEKKTKKKDVEDKSCSSENRRWLYPNIKVRVISTSFKKGKYYNKKAHVLDVTSSDSCSCKTEEKKVLDDVHVSFLETVIPKSKGSYVMIVYGKYRGKHAKLLERNKSECSATVQLLSNKHVTSVNFDDISEFVGELPDDEFL